jgi:MYXO-CTERM domain-containing protein
MIRPLVLTPIALAALTSTALAHFRLDAPAADRSPDPQGKTSPCGNAAPATNKVTNYSPGQMMPITLEETVNHPGHYRVSIAQSEAMLPPVPIVTPGGTPASDCGSVPIVTNPTLPILADGLFPDLAMGQGPKTVQIKLPDGMTCPNCVLQVVEFMSNHDAPCFYYHCAKVNIVAGAPDAGPPGPDAGNNGGPDAGNGNTGGASGGCSTSSGAGLALALALGLLGLVVRRRRR